ncbi:hypothetical protein HPP92_000082, partial [Vanilla planifolia]
KKTTGLLMIMNFFFSYGKYNGSTLAILGRNEIFSEVREMPIGKIQGDTFIVMDVFALPVEGTETRVNALADVYEYTVDYSRAKKQAIYS